MPPTPKDEWVNLNGMSFHYREWGGSGQPIVLLHGLASNCHIWDMVAPFLAENNAVIALDQRGHGESAKPDSGYDFATVSNDLMALIHAKNMERPIVVGHSWGGDVALEFAVSYPDETRGICFVDGGMIEPSVRHHSLEKAKEEMAPPIFTGVTKEVFLERFRSRGKDRFNGNDVEDIVLANFEVLDDNTIRANLSRDNHLRIIEALWNHHPPALYPKVKCPVLIMPARQLSDWSAAERDERRAKALSVAESLLAVSQTKWMEESIHDVPIQRPELVAGTILEQIDAGFFG